MLFTLTYESVAERKLGAKEMDELLDTARSNNKKLGVTGCLIYYMGGFVQVLEGKEDIIWRLYEKIRKDPRHKNIYMFSTEKIQKRDFPNWGMAYYPIDENNTNDQEFEQFKRNLLLLGDLIEPSNVTARLFWTRIKLLISSPQL